MLIHSASFRSGGISRAAESLTAEYLGPAHDIAKPGHARAVAEAGEGAGRLEPDVKRVLFIDQRPEFCDGLLRAQPSQRIGRRRFRVVVVVFQQRGERRNREAAAAPRQRLDDARLVARHRLQLLNQGLDRRLAPERRERGRFAKPVGSHCRAELVYSRLVTVRRERAECFEPRGRVSRALPQQGLGHAADRVRIVNLPRREPLLVRAQAVGPAATRDAGFNCERQATCAPRIEHEHLCRHSGRIRRIVGRQVRPPLRQEGRRLRSIWRTHQRWLRLLGRRLYRRLCGDEAPWPKAHEQAQRDED